ncbi:hypothetical protein [Melaminivora jejuensis]|uniref:hypothetical protein n=1 Tax=Melaminivora jejuensis TaxID=1267217 RepID=UPI002D7F8C6C|nr:hypothetical protein [Melaminivora jejuensis]
MAARLAASCCASAGAGGWPSTRMVSPTSTCAVPLQSSTLPRASKRTRSSPSTCENSAACTTQTGWPSALRVRAGYAPVGVPSPAWAMAGGPSRVCESPPT